MNGLTAKNANAAKKKLLFKKECYAIQGAAFEVYKEMGCGFLEAVYQGCLEKELSKRDISFKGQVKLQLNYKGEQLNQTYKPDFIRITNSNFRDFSALRGSTGDEK